MAPRAESQLDKAVAVAKYVDATAWIQVRSFLLEVSDVYWHLYLLLTMFIMVLTHAKVGIFQDARLYHPPGSARKIIVPQFCYFCE